MIFVETRLNAEAGRVVLPDTPEYVVRRAEIWISTTDSKAAPWLSGSGPAGRRDSLPTLGVTVLARARGAQGGTAGALVDLSLSFQTVSIFTHQNLTRP